MDELMKRANGIWHLDLGFAVPVLQLLFTAGIGKACVSKS